MKTSFPVKERKNKITKEWKWNKSKNNSGSRVGGNTNYIVKLHALRITFHQLSLSNVIEFGYQYNAVKANFNLKSNFPSIGNFDCYSQIYFYEFVYFQRGMRKIEFLSGMSSMLKWTYIHSIWLPT